MQDAATQLMQQAPKLEDLAKTPKEQIEIATDFIQMWLEDSDLDVKDLLKALISGM